MKKFLLVLLTGFFINPLFSQLNFKTETEYFPGEVMVQTRNGYSIEGIIRSFPERYELTVITELSKMMRIWHLKFNDNVISHEELITKLLAHPGIRLAQNNHLIEERSTMPNDPNTAANQWHHLNTGQTGGTADADIDSDEAWDITTGGLTVQGDTIVVCIVEGGGALFTHPDLIDNFWRNHGEIPNNSIDDDNNGYVDDYEGWNVNGNNDNHSSGNHGTQCMGMIGAKGDNNVGVVGANWNVKMMLVSGFSTSESSVISAYSYPLKMRQMYNSSNGAEGAFVVATSASWGIDNADPANYPLWCAFYDTLGTYGILNPGATTNNNTNVDVAGDMPTACASDYMISVTRTSATDSQAGGYGATTVDFGAPGISVYTTSGTSSYGTTTGTSFSCPLTAGVIGLIYSAPCNSLITLAKGDPQAAADLVLQSLLQGVDQVSSMQGISVTGGRLNAFNSINYILNNCDTSGCITPYGISVSNILDTAATISWSNGGGTDFLFYIREVGSPTWDSSYVSGTDTTLTSLLSCTEYEYMVRSVCTPDTSNYSNVFNFTTDGCCEAPGNVMASLTSSTSVDITFSSVLAASSYNVYYKPVGSSTWTSVNVATNNTSIAGLDSCTAYEVQVQTICGTDSTGLTPSVNFTTGGCGDCEILSYCAAQGGNSTEEWIANVTLNTINNTTGNDGGYLYAGIVTDLYAGSSYPISLTPDYPVGSAYDEQFIVWIDYNINGTFESSEEVYDSGSTQTTVNGNITLPNNVTEGIARMRVAMKYVGGTSPTPPTECGTFTYGEVEDYCVNLIDTTFSGVGVNEQNATVIYQVYPNPSDEQLTIYMVNFKEFGGTKNFTLTNSIGEIVYSQAMTQKVFSVPTKNLAAGIYYYRLDIEGIIRTGKIIVRH